MAIEYERTGRMKYHLISLGCQMNKSDGERVSTVMEKMGYVWTDREEEANLLGVLACSVRQKSIDKVYSKIQKWNKSKDHRNLITFISGCILPKDKERFLKLFDILFHINELEAFPDMIKQYGIVTPVQHAPERHSHVQNHTEHPDKAPFASAQQLTSRASAGKTTPSLHIAQPYDPATIKSFWQIQPRYASSYDAYIPIQNGCDKFCTFCAVPYTRGREVSRSSKDILDELKMLVDHGYKSITLLGQNVNSYGLDKHGDELSFAGLLRQIGAYGAASGKKFWVYFTSPHPRDMEDEIIDVIARYDCLAKQIHLPVQSGDNKVLMRMNRKHNIEKYRRIVHKIRSTLPQATLFTDIIVGFTGETEGEFENTRKIMEEFRYNMAYIAKYSPRPGAASSRWADDVPHEVKKTRLEILTNELKTHAAAYNAGLVGKTIPVLVTGKDRKKGYLSGLTEGKINIRFPSSDTGLTGRFVRVNVTTAAELSIEGELEDVMKAKEVAV